MGAMKWLTLREACLYARRSRNTVLSWIKDHNIYGTKPDGSGDWLVDRESIDKFLGIARDERRIRQAEARRDPAEEHRSMERVKRRRR